MKSGKVIDLDRNDQTSVIQFSPRNTDNQQWDVIPAEPRRVLTCWLWHSTDNQQWDVIPAEPGYWFFRKV